MGKKELIETLNKLSVLELAELKDALKEEWGVEAAAAAVAVAAPAAGGAAESSAAEATDFKIELTAAGDKKMAVIKAVREVTSLGLKEAKELVEAAPKVVKDSAPKAEADEIKKKLEEAGATVQLTGL